MQDGAMSVFSAGKCLDTVVFEDTTPKFKEHLIVAHSSRIDTLIVIPV
jgi:hypothetical protein